MLRKNILVLLLLCCGCSRAAHNAPEGDFHVNGYFPELIALESAFLNQNYTLIDPVKYQQTVKNSRQQVTSLLTKLQPYRTKSLNDQVLFTAQQLADIPYIFSGGMGEGDWQPAAKTYQLGANHIQQDPVYRTDGLNCQTYVQMVMALLHSNNLSDFEPTILKIDYGAAGNPDNEIVHYFNRNNFVDGDLNPINENNGYLKDVTSTHPDAQTVNINITRNNWFSFQQKNLAANVRVFSDDIGEAMDQRFTNVYTALPYAHFDNQPVKTSYLPKEKIAIKQADGSYLPNQALLDSIPTPAVVEIVRDPAKWLIAGKPIKDVIGTELSVSHLGLLYRQSFTKGQVIYQKISCSLDASQQKICTVQPVICQQANGCNELMLSHATDAYPNGYYWAKQSDGSYTCSATQPTTAPYTMCNRVLSLPLFDYLTEYEYGSYWYMQSPSLMGVHIEQLL